MANAGSIVLPSCAIGLVLYIIYLCINPFEIFINGTLQDRLLSGIISAQYYYVLVAYSIWQPTQWYFNLPFLPLFLYNVYNESISYLSIVITPVSSFMFKYNLPPVFDFIKGAIGFIPFVLAYSIALVYIGASMKQLTTDSKDEEDSQAEERKAIKAYVYYPVYAMK